MVKVNFNPNDFKRNVSKAADLLLKNRFYEQNPSLTDDGNALIARPGLRRYLSLGDGPVRGIFSEPGAFAGALFVASAETLYRVDQDNSITVITGGLFDPDLGSVNMAITQNIEDVPEYLFFADGRNLWLYIENGFATGLLSGTPANNDVVRIGSTYYQWTSGSVNAGTPAGTLANPWLVALGGSPVISFENIFKAIDVSGIAGTTYSTNTSPNLDAVGITYTPGSLGVRATTAGGVGNGVVTTETGGSLAWGGGTLSGGGSPSVTQIQVPDDVGVIDVAVINSFVIVIPAQGEGINGRFYWIEPGETTINPLNFATAERSPDPIFSVKVIGDQFWLCGESTTEVWYVDGSLETPMQRLQGVVFDRGTWEGTAVAIDDTLVVCDVDGAVFAVRGGQPQRLSTPDIEEQIRKSIQVEQYLT